MPIPADANTAAPPQLKKTSDRMFVEEFSLSPPYQQEDNNRWAAGGRAIVEAGQVRLTPDLTGSSGMLWARSPSVVTDWEVQFEFRVAGSGLAGEGFAFWFVERPIMGPVLGGGDFWQGLGIFFDSAPADGKSPPIIAAVYNDGTIPYSAFDDARSQAIGACHWTFRNLEERTFARVTYLDGVLAVEVGSQAKGEAGPKFDPCLSAPAELGLDKFFGFTALTRPFSGEGDAAPRDEHVIVSVATNDISPVAKADAAKKAAAIAEARKSYKAEVEEEHAQLPGHKDMATGEFQHFVVAILQQLQGTQNMMLETQLRLESVLRGQAAGAGHGPGVGGPGRRGAVPGEGLAQVLANQELIINALAEAFGAEEKGQPDKLAQILAELRTDGKNEGFKAELASLKKEQQALILEFRDGLLGKLDRDNERAGHAIAESIIKELQEQGLFTTAASTSWLLKLLFVVFAAGLVVLYVSNRGLHSKLNKHL